MVGWHDELNGHESDLALVDGEGQRSLTCCSPRGHKELDTTSQLNNNENSLAEAADPEDDVLAF